MDAGNFVFGDKINNWMFLLNIASGIKVVDEPTFNFISLKIPHGPNIMDSQFNFQPDKATYLDEAHGTLKAISGIISQMKILGVYNNTMIVLISDHGWVTENKMFDNDFSDKVPAGLEKRLSPGFVNPLFLVKDINSSDILRTSNILLSNSDLPSIVCSVISSCDGIPTDVRQYHGKRTLIVDNYKPENEQDFLSEIGFKGDTERYEVTDNVFKARNWKKVDKK